MFVLFKINFYLFNPVSFFQDVTDLLNGKIVQIQIIRHIFTYF